MTLSNVLWLGPKQIAGLYLSIFYFINMLCGVPLLKPMRTEGTCRDVLHKDH